jgi:hypothetical protein
MTDMLEQIDEYVAAKLKDLSASQLATLGALLFAGYRGERDHVLLELLKSRGENEITHSELTESYSYSFEKETAQYSRIKPEFFRAVRKQLYKR